MTRKATYLVFFLFAGMLASNGFLYWKSLQLEQQFNDIVAAQCLSQLGPSLGTNAYLICRR